MSGRRSERGAVLVEAAIVLPVLMLFILGLIDLAMWDFQRSQASSAARDGARAGIVAVTNADCAQPCVGALAVNHNTISDAIAAKLGGKTFTFTVKCMSASSTLPKTCAATPATVDRDRVEVHVTWNRPAMTFVSKMVGASSTVQATSRMTLTG